MSCGRQKDSECSSLALLAAKAYSSAHSFGNVQHRANNALLRRRNSRSSLVARKAGVVRLRFTPVSKEYGQVSKIDNSIAVKVGA